MKNLLAGIVMQKSFYIMIKSMKVKEVVALIVGLTFL